MKRNVAMLSLLAVVSLASSTPARADIFAFDSFGNFSSFTNLYGREQENVLAADTQTGEPASMALLGSGLLALAAHLRRRRTNASLTA